MKKFFVTAAALATLMTAGGAAARDRWVGDYSAECGDAYMLVSKARCSAS